MFIVYIKCITLCLVYILLNIVFFNICCFIVLDMNSVSTVCLTASKCFQCHSPAPHCTLLIDTSTLLSDTRKHPDDNSDIIQFIRVVEKGHNCEPKM